MIYYSFLNYYGMNEFSTKQPEKDFGDAVYATIRGFVLKFLDLGLFSSVNTVQGLNIRKCRAYGSK